MHLLPLISVSVLGLCQWACASAAARRSQPDLWRRQQVNCPVSPTTVSDCTYFVCSQAGDDCQSLSDYWGITEAEFIDYNPIVGSQCQNFAIDQGYCVEENHGKGPVPTSTTTSAAPTGPTTGPPSPTQSGLASNCIRFYKVQSGDTCQGIVSENHGQFTLQQFYSWNPSVGSSCGNLEVNVYVCTAVPGIQTTGSVGPTSTSTTGGPSPVQSGIASNCDAYYLVQSGDSCSGIVSQYGNFTVSQFYSWNPAVGSSCTSLIAGDYVCVGVSGRSSTPTTTSSATTGTPSPVQSGIASNCNKYYQAVSGDSCDAIASKFCTFTTSQFESWNPAVGSDCTRLIAGDYYCVGVPGIPSSCIGSSTATSISGGAPTPHQTGIASNCVRYYQARSGDSCDAISSSYCTFTTSQFESWNPAVGSDCTKLIAGDYYCVAVPTTPTKCLSTTTSSATPTPSNHGPQPQQSGIPSNCNAYHKVGSGDNCQNIENNAHISDGQFHSWNPSINAGCTNLYAGYYVCIGVS